MSFDKLIETFDRLHVFHYQTESIGNWDTCSSTVISSDPATRGEHYKRSISERQCLMARDRFARPMESGWQCWWSRHQRSAARSAIRRVQWFNDVRLCLWFLEKYWLNPQYLIRFDVVGESEADKWCNMIIGLISEEEKGTPFHGKPKVAIRLDLYKVNPSIQLFGTNWEMFRSKIASMFPVLSKRVESYVWQNWKKLASPTLMPGAAQSANDSKFVRVHTSLFPARANTMREATISYEYSPTKNRIIW